MKKLIKYDLQQRNDSLNTKTTFSTGPERLHSASTFSSRTRSRGAISDTCCSRDCQKAKTIFKLRNIRSEPNIGPQKDNTHSKRECACVQLDKKPEVVSKESKTTQSSSNNSKIIVPF